MFMAYMHCSIIRNVSHGYWALVGVTALSSLVATGAGFLVARDAIGGVTLKTLLLTVNIIQTCRRGVFVTGGTGGFHYENLRCGRRREYGIGMTAAASSYVSNVSLINITLSFACLSRCHAFVVACSTVGGLSWQPAGAPAATRSLQSRYNDNVTVLRVYI